MSERADLNNMLDVAAPSKRTMRQWAVRLPDSVMRSFVPKLLHAAGRAHPLLRYAIQTYLAKELEVDFQVLYPIISTSERVGGRTGRRFTTTYTGGWNAESAANMAALSWRCVAFDAQMDDAEYIAGAARMRDAVRSYQHLNPRELRTRDLFNVYHDLRARCVVQGARDVKPALRPYIFLLDMVADSVRLCGGRAFHKITVTSDTIRELRYPTQYDPNVGWYTRKGASFGHIGTSESETDSDSDVVLDAGKRLAASVPAPASVPASVPARPLTPDGYWDLQSCPSTEESDDEVASVKKCKNKAAIEYDVISAEYAALMHTQRYRATDESNALQMKVNAARVHCAAMHKQFETVRDSVPVRKRAAREGILAQRRLKNAAASAQPAPVVPQARAPSRFEPVVPQARRAPAHTRRAPAHARPARSPHTSPEYDKLYHIYRTLVADIKYMKSELHTAKVHFATIKSPTRDDRAVLDDIHNGVCLKVNTLTTELEYVKSRLVAMR